MNTLAALAELGLAVREARLAAGLTTVEVARASGRSRDVLHRLETGQDVSVSSLLSILAAIGQGIELSATARPLLSDMQRRFAHLHEPAAQDETEEGLAVPAKARRRHARR